MNARKLKRFECARIVKLIQDEIDHRHRAPSSPSRPCGDPADIVAMRAAIAILCEHSQGDDREVA